MADESIVKAVQVYLKAVMGRGIPVAYGVLYGSQVTGVKHRWSDIDVLVVSPQYDRQVAREDIDLLWHVAAQTDNRIEPVPVGLRQFAEDDASAVIEIARRQGQVIPLAD